jgi:Pterin 4 alpha carbinolamine dehydratase
LGEREECEDVMPMLAQRPCIPCRGGVEPLTREQCAPYLAEVSDWELDSTARGIKRRFQFRDYRNALAFANAGGAQTGGNNVYDAQNRRAV